MHSKTTAVRTTQVREKIIETPHYQSMSKMLQNLHRSSNNVRKVHDALIQISRMGFKNWYIKTNFRYNNGMIIKEIIERYGEKAV